MGLNDDSEQQGLLDSWREHVVPRRLEMLHLSWVFLWASITLTTEFILIHRGYLDTRPGLVNGVGLVSCIFWLHGFLMLVHWLVAISAHRLALAGAIFKTIAAVLFNVQPFTALLNNDGGCAYTNLIAICFFHFGNMLSMFDMLVTSRDVQTHKAPVLGMACYLLATTLLVAANAWVYETTPGVKGFHPGYAPNANVVSGFQITGGTLLGLGSLLFIHWAGWLPRVGKRPAGMPGSVWEAEVSY
eukprot:Sspe_Gene.115499::Locus_103045_Transcript_1_1_Confidence_1.000_Length_866::g.115499::m.115499